MAGNAFLTEIDLRATDNASPAIGKVSGAVENLSQKLLALAGIQASSLGLSRLAQDGAQTIMKMEVLRMSLAGLITGFSSVKEGTREVTDQTERYRIALAAAERQQETTRKLAVRLGFDIHTAAAAYNKAYQAMNQLGGTEADMQRFFAAMLRASRVLNVSIETIVNSLGRMTAMGVVWGRDEFGRAMLNMGINDDVLKRMMRTRTGLVAMAEAFEKYPVPKAETLAVSVIRLKNAMVELGEAAGGPVVGAMREIVAGFTAELGKPENIVAARQWGQAIADTAKSLAPVAKDLLAFGLEFGRVSAQITSSILAVIAPLRVFIQLATDTTKTLGPLAPVIVTTAVGVTTLKIAVEGLAKALGFLGLTEAGAGVAGFGKFAGRFGIFALAILGTVAIVKLAAHDLKKSWDIISGVFSDSDQKRIPLLSSHVPMASSHAPTIGAPASPEDAEATKRMIDLMQKYREESLKARGLGSYAEAVLGAQADWESRTRAIKDAQGKLIDFNKDVLAARAASRALRDDQFAKTMREIGEETKTAARQTEAFARETERLQLEGPAREYAATLDEVAVKTAEITQKTALLAAAYDLVKNVSPGVAKALQELITAYGNQSKALAALGEAKIQAQMIALTRSMTTETLNAAIESLRLTGREYEAAWEALVLQVQERIRPLIQLAAEMFKEGDIARGQKLLALVMAYNNAMGPQMEKAGALAKAEAAAVAGEWDKAWEIISAMPKKYVRGMRESLQEYATLLDKFGITFAEGMQAAYVQVRIQTEDFFESARTLGLNAWSEMQRGLRGMLSGLIHGDFDALKNAFVQMLEGLLQAWIDFLAKMLERWILNAMAIKSVPVTGNDQYIVPGVPMSGQYGMQQGTGTGPMGSVAQGTWGGSWGAWGQGVLGAYGLTSGIQGLSRASTTGQYIGSAMQTVGGAVLTASALSSILGAAGAVNIIPVWGQIAAVILVVIGLIVSLLTRPPEIKYPVFAGGLGYYRPYETAVGTALWNAYGTTLGGLAGIAKAGGGNVPSVLSPLRGGRIPDEFYRSQQVTLHAGTPEDIQQIFEAYVKTYLPKALMSFAFGRTMVGWSPQNAPLSPGVWSQPVFGGIDFTKPTPIVQMMQGLGFTNQMINEVARQIDIRSVDDFVEWVTKLVGAVKGLSDLVKDYGKDYATIQADLAAEEVEAPDVRFKKSAQDIKDMAAEVNSLVGDEQLDAAKDLVEMARQRYEEELEYLRTLRAMIKQIRQEAESAVRDIRRSLMTPEEGYAEAMAAYGAGKAALGTATNEKKVAEAWAEILENFQLAAQYLVARVQALKDLTEEWGDTIDHIFGKDSIIDPTVDLVGWIKQGATRIRELAGSLGDLSSEEQIANAHELLDLAKQRYDDEMAMIRAIDTMILNIRAGIEGDLFSMRMSMASPNEQKDMIVGRMTELRKQIAGAGSAEEASALWEEFRRLATQLFGLYKEGDPNREAAYKWVEQQLRDVGGLTEDVLKRFRALLEGDLKGLGALLKEKEGLLAAALKDAKDDLTGFIADFNAAATTATAALDAFGAAVIATNADLPAILEQTKGLFTDLNTALSGTGTGIGGPGRPPVATAVTDLGDAATAAAAALWALAGGQAASARAPQVTVNVSGGVGGEEAARIAVGAVSNAMRRYPEAFGM